MCRTRARVSTSQITGILCRVQISLRGFCRTPIRGNRGKLTHHQRLDVSGERDSSSSRFVANVSNVRVSQADDLTRIAGVGEDFLVSGETGIENDFSAAARNGASRAAVKYSAVFECKNSWSMLYFRQLSPPSSFIIFTRFRWGQRAK